MSIVLECKNLTKKYGKKTALLNVNIQLESGKKIGLLGPNGSGKTTLIKLANALLTPTAGEILIGGRAPSVESKALVSYLPDATYLNEWMKVSDLVKFFKDFYSDFNEAAAYDMLKDLKIDPKDKLKSLSKGTKEKVQLILVMSRQAKLYLLDEPIAGVDPAARDYILNTILKNYNPQATIILSTHLIADIESILDEVVFIKDGNVTLHQSVASIKEQHGVSVDDLFREVFKC